MKNHRLPWLVLAACIGMAAHAAEPAAGPAEDEGATQGVPAGLSPGEYPRKREIEGATMVVHAPQIRSWTDFVQFESLVAIEAYPGRERGSLPWYRDSVGEYRGRFGQAHRRGDATEGR